MEVGSFLADPTTWIFVSITTLWLIYRRGTANFNVFSDQGIPGPKPIPFIGNLWGVWRTNAIDLNANRTKKYGKVCGTFEGTTPILNISDAELVRKVCVKDFDHFTNRKRFNLRETKVFRWMISVMEDQKWKDVRSAITPAFTTGKIKRYSVQMKECTEKHCLHMQSIAADKGKLSLRDHMGVITMSIIARCAFGMTIDNLGGEDDPFFQNAKALVEAPQMKSPAVILLFTLPGALVDWMATTFFPLDKWQFFFDAMENMKKERAKSSQKFNDFIETATEAIGNYTREENGKQVPIWTKEQVDEIVTSQAMLFMVAGYSTTANVLTSCCFMLAQHQDEQEKLYDLIMNKFEQHGDICHEMVNDIPYLDQYINEVMRFYTPFPFVERTCSKDITYDGIHIPKGMIVSVDIHSLHHSEEYYTDPETFNTDRWTPENKAKLNPYAYMPFGMGPRNCLAMRFGLEEVKLILCKLIKEFHFFPVEETPEKLVPPPGLFSSDPVESVVGISSRT